MATLDRKLLRDLGLLRTQVLTIALVIASGIGGFIACLSAVESLANTRTSFYRDARFADLFGTAKRAPLGALARIRETEGVVDAQATVERTVRIGIEGHDDLVLGQLVGIDLDRERALNRVMVTTGRAPSGLRRDDGAIEVLVSEAFALGRGLAPGARLRALMNGRERGLVVVGTAVSPEYVFAGLFGMPDIRGFGVFWLDERVLAAAFDLEGAFDHLAVRLSPGASQETVAARLTALLADYGGTVVHGRAEQTSHVMLQNEIDEMGVLGSVLPTIFLMVGAFLLNMVTSRLISTQREQIATLKAVGYSSGRIAAYYVRLVFIIGAAGLLLGVVLGHWLGGSLAELYTRVFRFPAFEHTVPLRLVAQSAAVTATTALIGIAGALAAVFRLTPAEAMRPPGPGRYRRSLVEQLGVARLSPVLGMVVRNVERRPLRAAMSIVGVAFAVAVVILGHFVRDALDVIIDTQFNLVLRGDVTLWTLEPVPASAGVELLRIDGVTTVEPTRFVAVTFVHGHRRQRGLLRGQEGRATLYRVVDAAGRVVDLDGRGLVVNSRLAAKLDVRAGDTVSVEVLDGDRRRLSLVVGAVVPETMGLNAYVERRELNRLLGDRDLASGFVVATLEKQATPLIDAAKFLRRVAGAWSKQTMLDNMQDISARNVRVTGLVLTAFATVIAIGVVYNNMRIALAERSWELASLRVLGLGRGAVAMLLLGELALLIAIAIPIGMAIGFGLTHLVVALLQSDQFIFPVVVRSSTYAGAALVVVAAGIASSLVVKRRIDRIDLASALKARE